MVVYVLNSTENIKSCLNNVRGKNSLFILSFCAKSVNFLSKEYYKLLKVLLSISKENNIQFIMTFYICYPNKKFLNALYIKNGQVKNIFGESFTNKNCLININKKKILILFYFDVYSHLIKKQFNLSKIDLFIGLDNDSLDFDTVFLNNKFFAKLVLIGFNGEVRAENKENIIKKCENVC